MNIDAEKKKLRGEFARLRASLDPADKKSWDSAIARHIINTGEYRSCSAFLCYVPLAGEIDTVPLIMDALAKGKIVAVPYCVPGTRNLEFYKVTSLDNLREGAFGVREPLPDKKNELTSFENCLCLVPGYSFDKNRYRLGYGGGYYDRFLARDSWEGISVGACYSAFLVDDIIRDKYDIPCKIVVTQDEVYNN